MTKLPRSYTEAGKRQAKLDYDHAFKDILIRWLAAQPDTAIDDDLQQGRLEFHVGTAAAITHAYMAVRDDNYAEHLKKIHERRGVRS